MRINKRETRAKWQPGGMKGWQKVRTRENKQKAKDENTIMRKGKLREEKVKGRKERE